MLNSISSYSNLLHPSIHITLNKFVVTSNTSNPRGWDGTKVENSWPDNLYHCWSNNHSFYNYSWYLLKQEKKMNLLSSSTTELNSILIQTKQNCLYCLPETKLQKLLLVFFWLKLLTLQSTVAGETRMNCYLDSLNTIHSKVIEKSRDTVFKFGVGVVLQSKKMSSFLVL